MLTRCARTVRRTQHVPAYALLQLRQLHLDDTTTRNSSHTSDQVLDDSSEAFPDPQPWEKNRHTPLPGARGSSIFIDDLQATVEAQQSHSTTPVDKSTPRGIFPLIRKIRYRSDINEDGRRIGGTTQPGAISLDMPTSKVYHKDPRARKWVDDQSVQIDSDFLLKDRPIPSTLELDRRELESLGPEKPKEQAAKQRETTSDNLSTPTSNQIASSPRRGQWAVPNGHPESEPHRPWLKFTDSDTGDAMERLNAEIRAFERYMMLTQAEKRATEATTTFINTIAKDCGPQYKVNFHGSRCTGLAGPYSDIDVCLSIPEFEKEPGTRGPSSSRPKARKVAEMLLMKVYWALRRQPFRVHQVEMVHARIPLVTGYDARSNIKFQVMALTPVRTSLEFTAYYLSEHPSLRPLFFLLRHALEMRSLRTVNEGGLGSYPLFIMILTALNHNTGHIPRDDLATQLLHVLKFWSDADLYENGYSADPPRVFSKTKRSKATVVAGDKSAIDPYLRGIDLMAKYRSDQPFLLCLQDPGDPVNDLGKKTYLIRHIQALFRSAHDKITDRMKDWEDLPNVKKRREWREGILDSLVEGAYGKFEVQRKYIEQTFPAPSTEPLIRMTQSTKRAGVVRKVINDTPDQPDQLHKTQSTKQAGVVRKVMNDTPDQSDQLFKINSYSLRK